MSEYISAELRDLVLRRSNGICEYCRIPEDFSPQPFCFEHILPKFSGGETSAENLARACQGCNAFKGTRTEFEDEITGETVLLFNPRRSNWDEHFAWNEDFTEIIGITTHGRATVKALKLNRTGLKNLRQVLYQTGFHPPNF